MPELTFASALFSLFVPRDRAEEIEGDLIEYSRTRGAAWRGFHVMLIAIRLLVRSISKAPLLILMLGLAGSIALYLGVLGGELLVVSPVGKYLSIEAGLATTPLNIVVLSLSAAPLAFGAGYLLLRLAPLRGAPAGVVALALFGGFLTTLQIYLYPPELLGPTLLKAAFCSIPLLLGIVAAHRRVLRGANA